MPNEPQQPDLSNMVRLEPQPPITSAPPLNNQPGWNPFQRSPLPPSMNSGSADQLRQFYNRDSGPQRRVLPQQPAGLAGINSAARSNQLMFSGGTGVTLLTNNLTNASQSVLNLIEGTGMTLAADAHGGVTFSALATGDGLTHGTTPWESDPSYAFIREDFMFRGDGANGNTFTVNSTPIGAGWTFQGPANPVVGGFMGGAPPNMGQLWFADIGSAEQGNFVIPNLLFSSERFATGENANALFFPDGAFALLENPGWNATFVFKVDINRTSSAFSVSHASMYVGLFGTTFLPIMNNGTLSGSRPDVFVGVRYDASVQMGPFAITSCASHSGNTTVYTGTITGGGTTSSFIGQLFTVTGFVTNTVNNGTFLCTGASTTTLTLANNAGVAETHTASVVSAGTAPADSFFTLEVVANPTYNFFGRKNFQGTTYVTNVAPVAGVWHRLDVSCSSTGTVKLTLDGSATNTLTAAVPKITIQGTSTWCGGSNTVANQGTFNYTTGTSTDPALSPFSPGSSVTVAGFTSGFAFLNGTFPLVYNTGAGSSSSFILFTQQAATASSQSANATFTGYPSLIPGFFSGEGNVAPSGAQNFNFYADFCSLIWNPALGAGGTPAATKPRYW